MPDTKIVGKLVRDGIPDKIRRGGESPKIKSIDGYELRHALRKKLAEEATEVVSASGRGALIRELADVSEVYDELLRVYQLTPGDIEFARARKKRELGGFEKGFYLESVAARPA